MAHRILLLVSVSLLFFTACGGSLYKVKPVVELPAMTGEVKSGSAGVLVVAVAPLLSDEESQDLFEANLPLAGVLPLRVEVGYESGVPVEIKKAKFRLRDVSGKEWKLLSPKEAISRVLKANEVYAYNPSSRKQFEIEFGAYGLDRKTPLTSGEHKRQGFLFFQTPDKSAVSSPRGLVLAIEGLTEPLTITIN
ncbi:MAG TPA: hypothetical protein VJS64_12735 [Pyrinomonadaceae bacterium]|nr:hypothetical protein [Pyrinomonadaceae bacterium]